MSSPPSLRLRRPAVALVVLVALVVGLSACNPGRPPAATVEGAEISADRVDEIMEAYIEADPEVYGEDFRGQGDDTLSLDVAANVLTSLVRQVLQSQLAAERDAVPTDEERTTAEEQARTLFVQQEAAAPEAEGPSESEQASNDIFDALSEDTQQWLIDLQADGLALNRVLGSDSGSSEEAARQFYDENPEQFEQICALGIQVQEADLPAVRARLDAGEDFAAVSADVSLDPALAEAEGSLGPCATAGELQQQGFNPEILSILQGLDVGEVSEPFALGEGAGVALLTVSDKPKAAFEDVRDLLIQQLPAAGDRALAELLEQVVPDADVSVDPRFGTWETDPGLDPATGQERLPGIVVPPAGPDEATTDGSDIPDTEVQVEGVDPAAPPG